MLEVFNIFVLAPITLSKEVLVEMVSALMDPYDKALQVDEHDAQCPCMFTDVRAKAEELANSRVNAADASADSNEQDRNQRLFDRVKDYALDFQEKLGAAVQELADQAAPDPSCKECGGSGKIRTTANPNGKWTHWIIGGYFAGPVLKSCLKRAVDNPDIVPISALNMEKIPLNHLWAIITPDGEWHAAGDPFWFGAQRIDDPDWENTARSIIKRHADSILVAIECQP